MDLLPHLRHHIELVEATAREFKLETTPLPYKLTDLEPVMSAATLDYHYEHLARGYAERYNTGEGNADFNRAGSFLHNKFFTQFRPPMPGNRPRGAVLQLIEKKYQDFDTFKETVKETAMKIQGSGWIYLNTDGDIKTIPNHLMRTDIALLIDWWEHAWALDYQSNKDRYLDNIWRIINWDVINDRLLSKD